jgi:hypothetical protein
MALRKFAVKVLVCAGGGDMSARGAVEHAQLHEVGLVDFLDGVFFFAEYSGERAYADGAASILIEQSTHQAALDFVKTEFIHTEHVQGFAGDIACDASAGADFGEIADAAEQAVGDARSATAAASDFLGAGVLHFNVEDFGGPMKDDEEIALA